jgi:hypothetical protein
MNSINDNSCLYFNLESITFPDFNLIHIFYWLVNRNHSRVSTLNYLKKSTCSYSVSLEFTLILSSHLFPGLQGAFFLKDPWPQYCTNISSDPCFPHSLSSHPLNLMIPLYLFRNINIRIISRAISPVFCNAVNSED